MLEIFVSYFCSASPNSTKITYWIKHCINLTLLCILFKNGQTYFKNLPEFYSTFGHFFNIMHERVKFYIDFTETPVLLFEASKFNVQN